MTKAEVKYQELKETELNDLIVDAIQDIKGKKIVKMDLRDVEGAPTDFFIICEGESSTQIKAIADNIFKRVREDLSLKPSTKEGVENANWILVDYFNTVVHVFYPDTRAFYELEDLWSDAAITEYDSL